MSEEFSPDLLSPWCPFGENSRDAETLIVGQDFGIFKYLQEARNINGLQEKERENLTNKKLLKYLKSAGLSDEKIYFTNAILCIKNGLSMSSKVEADWFVNCSINFLKPLIIDHLPNLKTIITLGKYALLSIDKIVDSPTKSFKPFINVVAELQHIYISSRHYNLIPMLHPSFDHLSAKGQKENKKANALWQDTGNIIANLS